MTPKTRLARPALWMNGAAVLLLLVSLLLFVRSLPAQPFLHAVKSWIESLGWWGPAALGAIYIVGALLFFPGSILTLVAGAVYGLGWGLAIASLASTAAAALAFLIARYLARDAVRRRIERSPKLAGIDAAVGERGWKIVLLLRLSPAVPFTLQNYLFGVTSIRFRSYVLASWLGMLPGAFVYVYLGSLGWTALQAGAGDGGVAVWEWALRGLGLAATVAAAAYIAVLARRAIRRETDIESEAYRAGPPRNDNAASPARIWSAALALVLSLLVLGSACWTYANRHMVRSHVEELFSPPPKREPPTP